MLWWSTSSAEIVGLVFLDDTVNVECFLTLQGCIVPTLQGMVMNVEETFIQ
jgi:hypothetical protein